jgi:restriction endonuclease S subunit
MKKLKRISKKIQTGSTPPTDKFEYYIEEEIPWYAPGSFGEHYFLDKPSKLIATLAIKDNKARLFPKDSVMVVGIGATTGRVGMLAEDGSCNQQITAVVFDDGLLPIFGAYYLKFMEPVIRGIAPFSTLPIFDQERIGYIDILIPHDAEQRTIINYINKETTQIDSIINSLITSIDKIKEYRTALISAAVTGKIDVRGGNS